MQRRDRILKKKKGLKTFKAALLLPSLGQQAEYNL